MLKKRQHANMNDQSKEQSSGTGKDKAKAFDFSALLTKLRNKIKTIHQNNIVTGDVNSKPTLSLLNVSAKLRGVLFANLTFVHTLCRKSKCE